MLIMIVPDVVMVESEPFSKIGRTHVCKFVVWWTGWVPIFYYLMRATSSQGMQNESGDCVTLLVYLVSISFSILFSQHQFEASRLFCKI